MSKKRAWKGLYLDRGLSYLRFKGKKRWSIKDGEEEEDLKSNIYSEIPV